MRQSGFWTLAVAVALAFVSLVMVPQAVAQGNTAPDAVDDLLSNALQGSVETVINNNTVGGQDGQRSATLANGNTVIIWQDQFGDPDPAPGSFGIKARLYDNDGNALGSEFRVNLNNYLGEQVAPDVSALSNGGFVTTWISGRDARVQIHNSDGGIALASFRANSLPSNAVNPTTELRALGLLNDTFVVVWNENVISGQPSMRGRIYSNDGGAVGDEFIVPTTNQLYPQRTDIELLFDGSFLIGWQVENGGLRYEIRWQRFSENGVALGPVQTLDEVIEANRYFSSLKGLDDGRFLLLWVDDVSENSEDSNYALKMRFFASDGSSIGDTILAVPTQQEILDGAVATQLESEEIVVVWNSRRPIGLDNSGYAIHGRRFDQMGVPIGPSFEINTTVSGSQFFPTISSIENRGFFVSWTDFSESEPDTDRFSVRGRFYSRSPFHSNFQHSLEVLWNDSDADSDPLTITAVNGTGIAANRTAGWPPPLSAPSVGPVTLSSGAVVSLGSDLDYNPTAAPFAIALPAGATGDDSFTYTISDSAATDTANVTVTLTGVNDAPSADADAVTVDEDDGTADVTATLLNGDTDPDTGETAQLAVSVIDTGSTQGLVALNAGAVTYHPNGAFESLALGQSASDGFSYTISDPGGLTATAAVTVTVQGENDPPVADADALTFGEEEAARDVTATLLDGDTDPDAGETAELAVTAVDTTLTLGRVTLTDGAVTYDPNGAFNALAQGQTANDRFDYTISDPHGATASATVTVAIDGFAGYQLTVERTGLGAGTVTSSPPSLNCGGGGSCQAYFTQDGQVTLSRLVAPESRFEAWGDACQGAGTGPCVVTMSGNQRVTARFVLETPPAGRIVAATLPGARSGYVGGSDITVFMTVLSRATTPAQACRVTAPNDPPFTLTYRQINAQNQVIGDANPLFDLTNGAGINFVLGLTPMRTTDAAGYVFLPQISCENADLAPIEGVNSVLASIGAAPVPDILSIGATPSADGVVRIPATGNRINFLSAAAVNIGTGDGSAGATDATVTASVDTGAASLPVTLEVCETAPTGGCITPRGETEVTTVFAQNAAKFFAVFVRANGEETVPFNPANARVFLRFADASGAIRSVTSAAISAPAPATAPAEAASLSGRWSVLVRQDSGDWPSLRRASLYVLGDGTAILDDGTMPRRIDVTAHAAANDNDAVTFQIGQTGGIASAEGSIRMGDPLSDQPGAFWGVRDARSDAPADWTTLAGRYGTGLEITATGEIRGILDGCAVYGQVPVSGLALSLTLTGCDSAGSYAGMIDLPANDEGPALLIAGERTGWRLER